MKRVTINSKFGLALTAMRGHLAKCPECKAVMRGGRASQMCDEGVKLTHSVAMLSTKLVALHARAFKNPGGYIYPCPNRAAHGKDYASTVEPHVNVGFQPELF